MTSDASLVPTRDDILRMAKAYLARRAASRQQLRVVLLRKVRRRWLQGAREEREDAGIDHLIGEIVERLAQAGFLDDASLAAARALGLSAKGLPAARVREQLKRQGLADAIDTADVQIEEDDEAQARQFVRRKRLGPFASGRRAASTERDLRAMVRAGFSPRLALRVLKEMNQSSDGSGALDEGAGRKWVNEG